MTDKPDTPPVIAAPLPATKPRPKRYTFTRNGHRPVEVEVHQDGRVYQVGVRQQVLRVPAEFRDQATTPFVVRERESLTPILDTTIASYFRQQAAEADLRQAAEFERLMAEMQAAEAEAEVATPDAA